MFQPVFSLGLLFVQTTIKFPEIEEKVDKSQIIVAELKWNGEPHKISLAELEAAIGELPPYRQQVIGVAVLTISSGQNLNFAVPSNYLKKLLTKTGTVKPLSNLLLVRQVKQNI